MKYWLSQGVAARKLLLGIPFYGQSFTLDNAAITRDQAAVGVRARGAGYPGQFTKQSGMLAYYEICSLGRRTFHFQLFSFQIKCSIAICKFYAIFLKVI